MYFVSLYMHELRVLVCICVCDAPVSVSVVCVYLCMSRVVCVSVQMVSMHICVMGTDVILVSMGILCCPFVCGPSVREYASQHDTLVTEWISVCGVCVCGFGALLCPWRVWVFVMF